MSALAVVDNPRAVIGDNQPPMSPFEIVEKEILDLYQQAVDYLDGAAITTQGQADDVGNLLALIRAAEKKADAARTEENKPFDEGKSAVQARYAPLIADTKSVKGKTVLAADACKKTLAPWLIKLQAEIDAKAAAARKEADEKERLAREALRTADATNLAAREAAEQLVTEANRANAIAGKAEKTTAKAGGGAGRSIGLTTTYAHTLTDPIEFGRWCWANRKPEYLEFLNGVAKQAVSVGIRQLPGCTIQPESNAK